MMQSLDKNSRKKLFTIDEYHKMGDAGIFIGNNRVELIEGVIFYKHPSGDNESIIQPEGLLDRTKHSSVVKRINKLFTSSFHDEVIVQIQDPIQISQHSEPEPDVCLLKSRKDFYSEKHPDANDTYLLIEVSDTTLEFDKITKLSIYAAAGISEYWIIDIQGNQVYVHTLPQGKQYKKMEIFEISDTICCKHFPDISFPVKDILG